MKPPHIKTIELPRKRIDRAIRQEGYRRQLADWRAEKISDAEWEQMKKDDKEFAGWLWSMGM